MTYCLGIKVENGLVALADTRISSGSQNSTAKKISTHQTSSNHSLFIMTSGLRSVRDKAVTYFQEVLDKSDTEFHKLYKAVNAFASEVRRVANEDGEALKQSGFNFNLHAIVGGQLEEDKEPKLYLLYPEGNWVEVSKGSPYFIIGNIGPGKPLLDRLLKHDSTIPFSLKLGFVSFDGTRISSNDVDYPIDVLIFKDHKIIEKRYQRGELEYLSKFWQSLIEKSVHELPSDWLEKTLI